MAWRSISGRLLVVAASAWAAAGCGGVTLTSRPPTFEEMALQEVGDLYLLYTGQHKKSPQKPQDFEPYEAGLPQGYRRVRSGDIIVRWGVNLVDLKKPEETADSPDEVLAYEKKVPTQGGVVLMKNRTVRTMTAEQFKAAPKAGGSS
jgi:hypothetical protein